MALASFAETSFKGVFLSAISSFTSLPPVFGTARLAPAGCIANPAAGVQNGRASPGRKERALRASLAALPGGLSTDRRAPRSPPSGPDPGDRHMRPKRALLRLVEPLGRPASARAHAAMATPPARSAGRAKRRALRSEGLATGSSSAQRRRRRPEPAHDLPQPLDLPLGQIAEEGKRDVQRLGRHRPQRRVAQLVRTPRRRSPLAAPPAGPGPRTGALAGSSVAPSLTQATLRAANAQDNTACGKFALASPYSGASAPLSRRRSRCMPTKAERSRMSARPPGITGSRARNVPSASRAWKQT